MLKILKNSAVAALVCILLIPSLIFGAGAVSDYKAELSGPKTFVAGQQAEITVSLDAKDAAAFSGEIKYDTKKLEFKEASIDIAKGWKLETNPDEDVIYFACADAEGKATISGKTELFTLTFKVLSFGEGDTVAVNADALQASAGSKTVDVNAASFSRTYRVIEEDEAPSDSTDGDSDSDYGDSYYDSDSDSDSETADDIEKQSHNNMLESLTVKNAEISPAFDPEVKKYEAEVPYTVSELEVEATAQDPAATVEISQTELVYVGRNITKVVVTSESGLRRTYKIYTTRLAPEKKASTEGGANWLLIVLICVGAAIVIAAVVLLIIFRKKIFKK